MRNEVKTLIAALTTERDSIDRAIQGLRQMSDMRGEAVQVAASMPKKRRTHKQHLTSAQRSELVSRFVDDGTSAVAVAKAYGVTPAYVYQLVHSAKRANGNGSVEPQPDSSASAIGM